MTRKPHTISKKIALAVALVVLAAVALLAGNGAWHAPTSHSANGHGWAGRVQPSNGHSWS
jgi:hypothetical protein